MMLSDFADDGGASSDVGASCDGGASCAGGVSNAVCQSTPKVQLTHLIISGGEEKIPGARSAPENFDPFPLEND